MGKRMLIQAPARQAARRRRPRRRGFSLVEVIAAAALLAGTLTPTLEAMRVAMAQSRESHVRRLLASYAVRLLEDHCSLTMQDWVNQTVSGSFAAEGYTSVRFEVARSDLLADGGIPAQLCHIEVTVYDDADADTTLDANELRVTFRTKVAKLRTYETAPS
jgi:prepilin-type N-terminal cleavage/methylation domain-containing protein